MTELLITNARTVDGAPVDVTLQDGLIHSVEPCRMLRPHGLDAEGRTVMPGLADHHIHLLATAARHASVDLSDAQSLPDIAVRIRAAQGPTARAFGYHEGVGGLLDRAAIDALDSDRPVRIQDRTGALWMLNSPALAQLGSGPFPDSVECDPQGRPTGRIWRGDVWLRQRLGDPPPSLRGLSRSLAAVGVTAVIDAGANNGPSEAALLARAIDDGDLLQKLTLMGKEDLPKARQFSRGPLKLLYDECDLPDPTDVAARIRTARTQRRAVAAHCVTTAELLLYLAALELAGGALPGDRIEHGSVIPASLIADIARAGLVVVTQPGFIFERGDRYQRDIDVLDHPNLYRLQSLIAAGVSVSAGSDAPYGSFDPWLSMRAATDRRTKDGAVLGACEALLPKAALALHLVGGGRLVPGKAADLLLLDPPIDALTLGRNPVVATIIDGALVHSI